MSREHPAALGLHGLGWCCAAGSPAEGSSWCGGMQQPVALRLPPPTGVCPRTLTLSALPHLCPLQGLPQRAVPLWRPEVQLQPPAARPAAAPGAAARHARRHCVQPRCAQRSGGAAATGTAACRPGCSGQRTAVALDPCSPSPCLLLCSGLALLYANASLLSAPFPTPTTLPMQADDALVRVVSWQGDWVCGCGECHSLRDGCPSCGAASPCRCGCKAAAGCLLHPPVPALLSSSSVACLPAMLLKL